MSIYEKSVRLLLKDFVTKENIARGQIISKDQVISWFKSNYPKIKTGTITAHLIKMSTNAPSRVHYNANPNGEDDLFYQINGGHFRLYEKENDVSPLYIKVAPENITTDLTERSDEFEEVSGRENQQTGFAYESDLRDFLSKNLSIIESGLRLYEDEGISGVEFPVGGRFIDLLALSMQSRNVPCSAK